MQGCVSTSPVPYVSPFPAIEFRPAGALIDRLAVREQLNPGQRARTRILFQRGGLLSAVVRRRVQPRPVVDAQSFGTSICFSVRGGGCLTRNFALAPGMDR